MTQSSNYIEQVGGYHYGRKYGHWDYCKEENIAYLEGSATKYIYRWRLKAGIQDLKKALSFVAKLMIGNINTWHSETNIHMHDSRLERFFIENSVQSEEREIIKILMHWSTFEDLISAHTKIYNMITREESNIATAPKPKE